MRNQAGGQRRYGYESESNRGWGAGGHGGESGWGHQGRGYESDYRDRPEHYSDSGMRHDLSGQFGQDESAYGLPPTIPSDYGSPAERQRFQERSQRFSAWGSERGSGDDAGFWGGSPRHETGGYGRPGQSGAGQSSFWSQRERAGQTGSWGSGDWDQRGGSNQGNYGQGYGRQGGFSSSQHQGGFRQHGEAGQGYGVGQGGYGASSGFGQGPYGATGYGGWYGQGSASRGPGQGSYAGQRSMGEYGGFQSGGDYGGSGDYRGRSGGTPGEYRGGAMPDDYRSSNWGRGSGRDYERDQSGSGADTWMRGSSGQGGWGGGQSGSMRQRGAAPRGYQRSDERIKEDIAERLMDEGVDCSCVDLEVSGGVVTLSGEVPQRSDKYLIEQVACEISGVQDVDNKLRLRRSGGDGRVSEVKPSGISEAATTGARGGSVKSTGESPSAGGQTTVSGSTGVGTGGAGGTGGSGRKQ